MSDANDSQVEAINKVLVEEVVAMNAQDVDELMRLRTEDVVELPANGPPIHGPQHTRSWVTEFFKPFRLEMKASGFQEVVVAGDWAWGWFRYSFVLTPREGGTAVEDHGKNLWVLRRESDGAWRIAREIWNSDLAPSAGRLST